MLQRPNHSALQGHVYPVTLKRARKPHSLFRCSSCGLYGNGFCYSGLGSINIHLICVFLPTTIMHETHKHPLVQTSRDLLLECRACNVMCRQIGYRCKKCNFELTRSILEDLCEGRSPLVCIDRFRNYCTDTSGNCSCSLDFAKGKEILTLQREQNIRRLDILLRVLLIVQQLLQENRHGSKRDIYYMHPSVFKDFSLYAAFAKYSEVYNSIFRDARISSVVDRAINDICILLQCSRHNLNVVSVGKGWVPTQDHTGFVEDDTIFVPPLASSDISSIFYI
ncbi:unnamed protein product [Ilex paraguariensis]|uniref:Spo11/DNA topoisomerase VI subunit A N-terminal domain-containing protein n=1 Tax=Ilex paraguariensis TaxID=185542 RepID=A0ABC8RZ87_9AQUA